MGESRVFQAGDLEPRVWDEQVGGDTEKKPEGNIPDENPGPVPPPPSLRGKALGQGGYEPALRSDLKEYHRDEDEDTGSCDTEDCQVLRALPQEQLGKEGPAAQKEQQQHEQDEGQRTIDGGFNLTVYQLFHGDGQRLGVVVQLRGLGVVAGENIKALADA